jgi:hypothetical protein
MIFIRPTCDRPPFSLSPRLLGSLLVLAISPIVAFTSPANAQAPAPTPIETFPSSLTLTGTRCLFRTCEQPHSLTLRSSGTLSNIEVVPLPLSNADGLNLPATAITAAPIAQLQGTNPVITIPLQFNPLVVPSGEYSGEVLVNYPGGSQRVPVVIRVKDHWLLPLLVLFAGVMLGTAVSAYRDQGRPRDQVIARIGVLRSQMLSDPQVDGVFQDAIQEQLIDVETSLQRQQWESGESAIAQAEQIWIKWRKGRSDWLALIDYRDQLLTGLNKLGIETAFVRKLLQQCNEVIKKMPGLSEPTQLREHLDAIAQQSNQYAQMMPKMQQLTELSQTLPDDESAKTIRHQIQKIQQYMTEINPIPFIEGSDLTASLQTQLKQMASVDQAMDSTIATATPLIPTRRGMEQVGRGSSAAIFATPFAIAPATRPLSLERQIQKANRRLRVFVWTSYAIAVTFLAGAGFIELYGDKPTFGANPWRDYFTLLAWGFGAEATRDAVTRTVQNWQLPGIKE